MSETYLGTSGGEMVMQAKVSVIVPCYNGESVITQSIESIYSQDYSNVELIVVDDGSIDGSKQAILAWGGRFSQKGYTLKYVYQENRGLGGAIDTGLKYVTGNYLTLLDADDYFLPGSLRKRAEFLKDHPECVGVRSNGWMINGEKRDLFMTAESEKKITDMFSALIFGQTNNWAGSYMIRCDALFAFYPERNIYPSRFGQNMQLLLPVAYKRQFGYIDEPLMVYVIHENSHSQATSEEEQYQKDEYNQKGYRDIYIHMIDAILRDPAERRFYRNAFDASYYRCALLRAAKYGKCEALDQHYCDLKSTKLATLNDRITYYGAKKSPMVFLLKVIRRCKMMLKMI